jgi:hypothetical protein
MRMQADHQLLEVVEAGTWEEISKCHRDLIPASRSPSGKPNVYASIPYAFPASAHLDTGSPIGEALLGRKRWTNAEVVIYVRRLFGKQATRKNLDKMIAVQREKAAASFKERWSLVKEMEEQVFKKKSWGYIRRTRGKRVPADPAPDEGDPAAELEHQLHAEPEEEEDLRKRGESRRSTSTGFLG